ncbi:MAG TPA: ABC transporter ATP-binding protein [Chloroflexi bacterium]|nr:ABC transporter ATP-binding protein [Chloroflexota bacterium]|tara:strand:+ start:673 stop:1374 length:702 start_codon:yes stop_codon:yes gene_type:complete
MMTNDNNIVIRIEGISKHYQMGDTLVRALDGVDLSVSTGEMMSIVGPSGSGKSTLMAILGCLDKPTKGRYWLDGKYVESMNDAQLATIRGKKIGFVFQQFNLLARTSALENVMLPLTYAGIGGGDKQDRAKEALDLVGLSDRMYHSPSELSGGQQQRVAIARALVNRPAILLADEPTGALDSKTGTELMNLFETLHKERGITLCVVTHDPKVAALMPRTVSIQDGRISGDESK